MLNRTPFHIVTVTDHPITHLVVSSPALTGLQPHELPAATLCGRPVANRGIEHPADVQCLRCLDRVPKYMHLPAFQVCP